MPVFPTEQTYPINFSNKAIDETIVSSIKISNHEHTVEDTQFSN